MRNPRQELSGTFAMRPWQTSPGLLCALFLLTGTPAAAETPGGTDSLPSAGAYCSVFVMDSATGLPLAGTGLNIRNPEAYYSVARTDSGGWAHISRDQLPYHHSTPIQDQWVTAAYPGYVSRMATCRTADPASRVLRIALPRATAKNSVTFTGTLIDSATRLPIPGVTLDLSHGESAGWMTHLAITDAGGNFAFTGIPFGRSSATFWVRKPNGFDSYFPVSLTQSGQPIIVSGFIPTSLAAPQIRKHAAGVFPFRFRDRDAAGRRRNGETHAPTPR